MEFNNNHPTEEILERYLFESLTDWEVEAVEEHLLVCHSCIDTAEQLLAFMQSLRSTLGDMPKVRTAGTSELQER